MHMTPKKTDFVSSESHLSISRPIPWIAIINTDVAPASTRRGLLSSEPLLWRDTSARQHSSPGNPSHNKVTWSETLTEWKSYYPAFWVQIMICITDWAAGLNRRFASPCSYGTFPQWKGESEETFSHVDTWKKTMCLFDKRVVTGEGLFLSPVSNKSQVGGDFQSSWSIQQHCLWPLLLIAVEQNGLAVQTTPPPPPLHPLMVSAPRRLSVFQGRDGLRKTEATVVRREGENEKEMHGQMGLKWQQSALMETDGRMRR